ncbi:unnamed protein product [Callosobruchus maculatus]|uniref:Kinetochore protein Spc24 n=1 Tax=Callosobruchus maculatus TaxID=64391 RepID=A0A653D917_CALMS|nr:unnamed protein product [Callosobruchus maculatus]
MEGMGHAEEVAAVISNTVTPIMSQIIRDCEDFDLYQDELEENCEQNLSILKINGDDILSNILSKALKLLDSFITQNKEEADVIDLEKETERLKHIKCELESKIASCEKELKKQNNDLKNFEADPELQTMRDTIQAWKLATKINFVYEGTSDECGYGIGRTGKMKPFRFNPKEKTKKEITNALYEIMNSSK